MTGISAVKLAVALAAAALLAGCASVPAVPDEQTLRLNALLDEISRGYAVTSQCLSTSLYRNVEIIDDQHLLFRGSRDRAWMNELRSPCTGLRRNDTLLFELHGSRACKADRVSVIETFMGFRRTGPSCALGEFKPIPPGYVDRIDALLRGD